MTSPTRRTRATATGLAAITAVVVTAGCSKEPPPVAQAPPPKQMAPAPPPPPAVTPVSDLMARLRIDERVVLPEDKAPGNDADRIAILEYFDAFARGDHTSLQGMLSVADRVELDTLIEKGIWQEQVEQIEMIEIEAGDSDFGPCVLAIFTTGLEFQPQLWYYKGDEGGYTFDAAPAPPNILDRMAGGNAIQAWHDVWTAELARAEEPDEDLDMPQVNLDEDTSGGSGPSAGGPSGAPGKGPRNPGRRPPRKNPRKPPGPR